MTDYIPDQGDIVLVSFDPSLGTEIIKRRPALVVSKKYTAAKTGLAFVCPITSTDRGTKIEVSLAKSLQTKGVVLPIHLKSLDYIERNFEFVEKADIQAVYKTVSLINRLVAI